MHILSWHNFGVFFVILRRDCKVFFYDIKRFLLNFGFFRPVALTIAFGYLLPYINFVHPSVTQVTIFFAGAVLWSIFPVAFMQNLDFLIDREHERYIDYQIIILDPRLIILEKIVFTSLVCFLSGIFFFCIAKMLLGSYFLSAHISWPALMLMLYFGGLFCAAFNLFFVCFIKDTQSTGKFWIRVNNPMMMLGGLFVPWHVMFNYSKILAMVMLFNPLIYLTEGLRSAIIGGQEFFSLMICVPLLLIFSLLFYLWAVYYFKQKMDYV